MLNERTKKDFPILRTQVRNKPLVYLDNSATTQKPQCVIDAFNQFYSNTNANPHRGIYELSERATRAYENTRTHIQKFINAKAASEIIFVRGTTEAINLVAQSYSAFLKNNDEIIISAMEHHSNILPWQLVCEKTGAKLKIIPITDSGEIDLDGYKNLFSKNTKFVSITHASNVLGTINPIKEMIRLAHLYDVPVLIDGAQAFPHLALDVKDLDCDFYTFSAHKAYGPTGVGVLYGKTSYLEKMPPYQGGGAMIEEVTFEKSTYNKLPYKFEAGTPNVSGVVVFDAALNYLETLTMEKIREHESLLLKYATERLLEIPGFKLIGCAQQKVGVISFVLDDIHPHDIGTILDHEGIAIRAGHHCAMPLMQRFQVPALARISFGLYNGKEDVDLLIAGLSQVKRLFA